MSNIRFGYMGTSLKRTVNDLGTRDFQPHFVEFQVHDNLLEKLNLLNGIVIPSQFRGCFTIHGEGETDGRARIKFCSNDPVERKQYISNCIFLYSSILKHFSGRTVSRVILHPDTISIKSSREEQIKTLAASLIEIADNISAIESICIEPRGSDRHKKVLRLELMISSF